jgi:hypothetical protein
VGRSGGGGVGVLLIRGLFPRSLTRSSISTSFSASRIIFIARFKAADDGSAILFPRAVAKHTVAGISAGGGDGEW